MQEAKNDYNIEFGPYSIELKNSQVYYRKNNSLMKAMPVKSTFGLYDLKKLATKIAKSVNMINKLPKDVIRAGVKEMEGVPHYTKDGKEWTGPTHKMPDGTLMTQDPHNDDSEKLFHKSDLKEAYYVWSGTYGKDDPRKMKDLVKVKDLDASIKQSRTHKAKHGNARAMLDREFAKQFPKAFKSLDEKRNLIQGDVEESTKQWTKTIKALAKQDQLKKITKKDKETLLKIVRLMKTANEDMSKVPDYKYTDTTNEAAPKMRKDSYVEKLRLLYSDIAKLDKQMSHADSSRYSHVKKDFNKALKAVAELTNTLNRKGQTIPESKVNEDYVKSGHMYKSLTYKVKDQQAVYDAYKKFKKGNRTINIVATNKGDTVTFSGHPTKGAWISPGIADQLDAAIQKTGKATLVKSDSKKLKENKMNESETKFRKMIREIAEPMLKSSMNESYGVIDPRGNTRPIGSKIQGDRFVKGKKGHYVILMKHALKARRAIEKAGGNATSKKIQDLMFDLRYEGKVNEVNLNEATKPIDARFVREWEKMVSFLQDKMEEYKKNPKVKKNNQLSGMANGAYNNMNTVKGIPAQWLKIDNMIGEGKLTEMSDSQMLKMAMKGAKAARVGSTATKAYMDSLKNSWRLDPKSKKDYKDFSIDDWEEDVLYYIQNKG